MTARYANPDIKCIAMSHCDEPLMTKWIGAVVAPRCAEIIVNADRATYGNWGLGVSSFWHALNPWSMKVGEVEEIWNRPMKSGSRW
jgi:hypothetical protein